MSIVQMGSNYKVCATCANWDGNREMRLGEVVCNNRDNGLCRGEAFSGWRMGAISTCTSWECWGKLALLSGENDAAPVKIPTP